MTSFVENGKALLKLAEQESKEGLLQDYIRKKISIELDQSLLGLIPAGARCNGMVFWSSWTRSYIWVIKSLVKSHK
ncbi:unnamed protein product, partial [Coregonus sp. 'balchen']